MTEVIASTQIVGVRPSGEKLSITVRIGKPYISGTEPETWSCPVSVDPLYSKLADIAGLEGFKEKGGQLLHEDGTVFPLEAYGFGNSATGSAGA